MHTKIPKRFARHRMRLELLEPRLPLDASIDWMSPDPQPFAGTEDVSSGWPQFGEPPQADTTMPADPSTSWTFDPSSWSPDPGNSEPPSDEGQGLSVSSTTPGDGAMLKSTPERIELRFSGSLAGGQRPSGTIVLERVTADGGTVSILGDSKVETIGLDGKSLSVAIGRELEPGRYRISLGPNAFLEGEDGSLLIGDGTSKLLGEFWVQKAATGPHLPSAPSDDSSLAGPTFSDAVDLGVVGTSVRGVTGSIDGSTPAEVAGIYQVTLETGHTWVLGLEAVADDGSGLDLSVAVYDPSGNLQARSLLGSSSDPYLFRALPAGRYFVVVTPASLGADRGSYDPVSGRLGLADADHSTGGFRLNLVADPSDSPTKVVSFSVDHADPSDPAPTGFTLGFDGPLGPRVPAGAEVSGSWSHGVEMVDAEGRVWPVRVASFDPASATVHFVFDESPPAGSYTVRLATVGGLVDLAGRSPITVGRPDGELVRFPIIATPQVSPGNLGAVLPGPALRGVEQTLEQHAGDPSTLRFVITAPGSYALKLTSPDGPVDGVRLEGPSGPVTLDEAALAGLNGATVGLEAGVYYLTIGTDEVDRSAVASLRALSIANEVLLHNGLGQGQALQFRIITPTLPGATSADLPSPGTNTGANTGHDTGSSSVVSISQGLPTRAGDVPLTWNAEMMGRPAPQNEQELAWTTPQTGAAGAQGVGTVLGQAGRALATPTAGYSGPEAADADVLAHAGADAPVFAAPGSGQPEPTGGSGVVLAEAAGDIDLSPQELLELVDERSALAAATLADEASMPEAEAGLGAPSEAVEAASGTLGAMGLDNVRLAVGVTLVAGWAVHRRLRRAKATVEPRGDEPMPASGQSFPNRRHWSFSRSSRFRPRLS